MQPKLAHSHPTDFSDRINKMDRIPNETGLIIILFILSKTLNATFRTTVRFPRKLGSFLPSSFRSGMAADLFP
jgi:hypothetical protein